MGALFTCSRVCVSEETKEDDDGETKKKKM